VVTIAGYLRYQRASAERGTTGGLTQIATVAVSMGDLRSTVRINGTIVAENSATLRAPRIMGSRGDFNRGGGGAHDHGPGGHPDFTLNLLRFAKAGTQVKPGDVVVEFDPENQLQRLDDYQDSVVQLKNSIRKMVANLAATKEAHEQSVRAAKADWQKALLDLKTSPTRSRIDAEKFRLNAEEAELRYKQLVAEQSFVEESQRASIRASELMLAQSAIELDRARNNVGRMKMTAPIEGIIVMGNVVLNGEVRQIREGDQVSPGQPILHVVDTRSMALLGAANQVDAERLRLGLQAAIRLDSYPEWKAGGSIVGIGAMTKVSNFRAKYVGEIPVRLRIDGRDPRLLPDLTGSADIVLHSERNVLIAPRHAVFTEDGRSFVYVKDEGSWTCREIATGQQNAISVEVRAGLHAGEILALQRPTS
jgi:multidrug efflux pump subunit AcrA (membrane-fusion protein)